MELNLEGDPISLCFPSLSSILFNFSILHFFACGNFHSSRMALPPEQINIKRRREEEPVDTLCKKKLLDFGSPHGLVRRVTCPQATKYSEGVLVYNKTQLT